MCPNLTLPGASFAERNSFIALLNFFRRATAQARWNCHVQAINLNTRIFSILSRKHNGDIRRMPSLLLRKITRKSTAVNVAFALVLYVFCRHKQQPTFISLFFYKSVRFNVYFVAMKSILVTDFS